MLLAKYSACTYVLHYVASAPASPPITCPADQGRSRELHKQTAGLAPSFTLHLFVPAKEVSEDVHILLPSPRQTNESPKLNCQCRF